MSDSRFSSRPKLVIVRPDRVGDVIISSSCLDSLRRRWPEAELIWAVREVMEPLFRNHSKLRDLLLLPHPEKVSWWRRICRLTEKLRALAPEGIVFLHPDPACQVAAWRARVPHRLGYQTKGWTWTLTRSLPYVKSEGKKHESEYNFDLLREWGVDLPVELGGDTRLDPAERDSLRAGMPWDFERERFAVLNPSAFSPVARWPAEYFARVAEDLLRDPGMRIVISGDSAGDPSAQELARLLRGFGERVLSLAGRTGLGELGWLLGRAEVLVTRDTGPSHLAAAVGCPVVVIFGRTDPLYGPVRWRPLGGAVEVLAHNLVRESGEKREKFWERCFRSISPERVLASVEKVRRRA